MAIFHYSWNLPKVNYISLCPFKHSKEKILLMTLSLCYKHWWFSRSVKQGCLWQSLGLSADINNGHYFYGLSGSVIIFFHIFSLLVSFASFRIFAAYNLQLYFTHNCQLNALQLLNISLEAMFQVVNLKKL